MDHWLLIELVDSQQNPVFQLGPTLDPDATEKGSRHVAEDGLDEIEPGPAFWGVDILEATRPGRQLGHGLFGNVGTLVVENDADATTWDDVGRMAWKLDRMGRVLPLTDIIIATCAAHEEAWVLTSDHHFDQIEGVRVLRPDF